MLPCFWGELVIIAIKEIKKRLRSEESLCSLPKPLHAKTSRETDYAYPTRCSIISSKSWRSSTRSPTEACKQMRRPSGGCIRSLFEELELKAPCGSENDAQAFRGKILTGQICKEWNVFARPEAAEWTDNSPGSDLKVPLSGGADPPTCYRGC
ncbi:uncharacterized protein RAG0_06364 [Rhynchosporium agropyri]|uniref:Uncharacterized protein n=1 Tax=Rhynchosporium agropyri TaxID=914238 RepID=A0A1E1KGS7_9HELO|nr:uncharacterized protein RAG0_06364 [Rhynchosporium agropyri]